MDARRHCASSATGDAEIQDPSALPWRFRGASVISTAQPGDCFGGRDACEHGNCGQPSPGPPNAAPTCDPDAITTNIVGGAMCSNTADIDPDFAQPRDKLLAFLEAL